MNHDLRNTEKPDADRLSRPAALADGLREGVVAVVLRDDRFLIVRRAANILAGGAWCFVGGGIEPGETQAEALVREFHEEVGGRITPVQKVWQYDRPDGRLRLHWWTAVLVDGPELVANPAEVAEIRWLTRGEIARLEPVLESNRQFLNEFPADHSDLACGDGPIPIGRKSPDAVADCRPAGYATL